MALTRTQQRYDYRLRLLVQHTGDLRLAAAHGVPQSTARGWVGQGPAAVVGLTDVGHAEAELRREVLVLRRRIGKLAALLRLALALSHASDVSLVRTRVPEGPRKARLLRAIDQARTQMSLRGVLRFLGISARRVQAWRRREHACTLGDRSSCPRTSPQRLTQAEVQAIGDMATATAYRHGPPAGWRCSRSGSAPCARRPRRGTASCGAIGGGVPDPVSIRRRRALASAPRVPTNSGTSTPPSSVCAMARARSCTR